MCLEWACLRVCLDAHSANSLMPLYSSGRNANFANSKDRRDAGASYGMRSRTVSYNLGHSYRLVVTVRVTDLQSELHLNLGPHLGFQLNSRNDCLEQVPRTELNSVKTELFGLPGIAQSCSSH